MDSHRADYIVQVSCKSVVRVRQFWSVGKFHSIILFSLLLRLLLLRRRKRSVGKWSGERMYVLCVCMRLYWPQLDLHSRAVLNLFLNQTLNVLINSLTQQQVAAVR